MRSLLFLLLASLAVRAIALSPSDQPTDAEHERYKEIAATDIVAAESYLATRNYVRIAREIVDTDGRNATRMPARPKNFSARYLSADGKDKDIINEAVILQVYALTGVQNVRTARQNAAAIPLKSLPGEEERATYHMLAIADQSEADSYLVTRDYLRKARAVVDGKGQGARQFPSPPRGYGLRHLSTDGKELAVIHEAQRLSIAAMSESR